MTQTKAQLIDGKSAEIEFSGGSAGAPAISFTGDTNTGIYSPGADQLALSTNGTGRLFINSLGDAGIGQSSPSSIAPGYSTLSVGTTSGGGIRFYEGATLRAQFVGNANGGTLESVGSTYLGFNTNGAERLRITSAGLVGVGTSSPSFVSGYTGLQVDGGSNGPVVKLTNSTTGSTSTDGFDIILQQGGSEAYIWQRESAPLIFGTAATERMRLDSSGRLGIGTSSPSNTLHVSSTGSTAALIERTDGVYVLSLKGTGTTSGAALGMATNDFVLLTNGAERLRVDSSGRVGIGTTSVSNGILHVKSNGTGSQNGLAVEASANDSFLSVYNNGSAHLLNATYSSTGSYQPISFLTGGSERGRWDTSGRFLVGTSSARATFGSSAAPQIQSEGTTTATGGIAVIKNNASDGGCIFLANTGGSTVGSTTATASSSELGAVSFNGFDGSNFKEGATIRAVNDQASAWASGDCPARLVFSTTADGASSPTERMRISNAGTVEIGVQNPTSSSYLFVRRDANTPLFVDRKTNDGTLVQFRQDDVDEGSISVSGTTVSYNGAHLSRWSQLPGGAERTEILRGSVLSNIDEMCEWGDEENEQLNRMKVSDVEGDKNVSGVFQSWDDDDDTYTNDFYCAMTGDFIIRIAAGATVERGDLLMSAGDGTAKPQDDDIIRSKTIAKVTSTHVTCTYDDGSYCVPCVLMAC